MEILFFLAQRGLTILAPANNFSIGIFVRKKVIDHPLIHWSQLRRETSIALEIITELYEGKRQHSPKMFLTKKHHRMKHLLS